MERRHFLQLVGAAGAAGVVPLRPVKPDVATAAEVARYGDPDSALLFSQQLGPSDGRLDLRGTGIMRKPPYLVRLPEEAGALVMMVRQVDVAMRTGHVAPPWTPTHWSAPFEIQAHLQRVEVDPGSPLVEIGPLVPGQRLASTLGLATLDEVEAVRRWTWRGERVGEVRLALYIEEEDYQPY
jgi:hypothetical protein